MVPMSPQVYHDYSHLTPDCPLELIKATSSPYRLKENSCCLPQRYQSLAKPFVKEGADS